MTTNLMPLGIAVLQKTAAIISDLEKQHPKLEAQRLFLEYLYKLGLNEWMAFQEILGAIFRAPDLCNLMGFDETKIALFRSIVAEVEEIRTGQRETVQ